MLKSLFAPIVGACASVLLVLNTLLWVPPLLVLAVLKLLLPIAGIRRVLTSALLSIAESWIAGNNAWMALTQRTSWDVQGLEALERKHWYLVNANHQSWVDVLVLQRVFNRRIPLLKFFLKRELMWVPFMGLAWWALDFPFMRRHSEDYLQKHPEMRGKDLETARKACRKFANQPTSVMNFLEGTRFSPAKQRQQHSPYKHLLKPKVGGIALALNTLGERFTAILDVTIVYPEGAPTFWQFLCGRVPRVVVRVRSVPVPERLLQTDYVTDPRERVAFRRWVNEMWRQKDEQISELLGVTGKAAQPAG
ncbi:acyltransferase [Schlegelella sp. S2-27]|uniref:Acyltransferase n=1 Tax=Caldimonas mangrovi TaxID=2944811 RepID=A0ABT0YVX8_9BURK|nr:acyltransferase [Caldimonas mangrovi]MCM5682457.1 acyltransferase [Caldimonas mangrovi]